MVSKCGIFFKDGCQVQLWEAIHQPKTGPNRRCLTLGAHGHTGLGWRAKETSHRKRIPIQEANAMDVQGGIDQVRCLPSWELTYTLPAGTLKRWFSFSQGGICDRSLEGKYPWPKSKPTSSNTVYCLPLVSGHCWTTKYNTHKSVMKHVEVEHIFLLDIKIT